MNKSIQSLSKSSHFNCLPNEVVLIIWTYVGHAEAIRIFGPMKCQRYTDLLEEYCYRSINFRQTSLSTFLLYCSHLFQIIRFNIQTLKLGHRTSYCQLRLFKQMRPGKWRREKRFFFQYSISFQFLFHFQKCFQNYKHLYCSIFLKCLAMIFNIFSLSFRFYNV